MKVLVVCRKKKNVSPFITEQVSAIKNEGINIQYFFIEGEGVKSYFYGYAGFKKAIHNFKPDLIHAHYGLSGLFANFQKQTPVITTFHGSDINQRVIYPFSYVASRLSKYNIFVSEALAEKANVSNNYSVQACGINFKLFYPLDKNETRRKLAWNVNQKYILFAGSFDDKVKNVALAKASIAKVGKNINLIELKGVSRIDVNLMLNACDIALMTSINEGSPQFIKEAMACNCPIISTNVGDVSNLINTTEGCYICSSKPDDIRKKIDLIFDRNIERTNGRENVTSFDNTIIAKKIVEIYKSILNQ